MLEIYSLRKGVCMLGVCWSFLLVSCVRAVPEQKINRPEKVDETQLQPPGDESLLPGQPVQEQPLSEEGQKSTDNSQNPPAQPTNPPLQPVNPPVVPKVFAWDGVSNIALGTTGLKIETVVD